MCSEPNIINGYIIPCRMCDECLAARRNTWAARACAEAATSDHVYIVNLTYNESPENLESSRAFRYANIVDFHKRLRSQIKYENPENHFRFIVAGEKGSKGTKRVHWHCIYFSNVDLTAFGEMHLFHPPHTGLLNVEGRKGIGEEHFDTRLTWPTMWPHGLVFFQRPDQGGMEYVLKYAMKDQFSALKSEGSKRYSKSDNHANGLFRMSRLPPIGKPYLQERLSGHLRRSSVDPSLKISVPGYSGYWYLNGDLRQWYLVRLKFINDERRAATRTDCPQWASLLSSLSENPKDLETIHGTQDEEEENSEGTDAEIDRIFEVQQRAAEQRHNNRETRKRCGQIRPCQSCFNSLNPDDLRAVESYFQSLAALYEKKDVRLRYTGKKGVANGRESIEACYRRLVRQCNPWCQLKETRSVSRAFGTEG